MLSVLSYLLLTERHRPRAASGSGFATPVMMERESPEGSDPCLVSTTRGGFVVTRRTLEGAYRFAFFHCPIEREGEVVTNLYRAVWDHSTTLGWGNRFRTPREALAAMRDTPAKTVILPRSLAESFAPGQEIPEGKVTIVNGLHVLVAPLPEQSAIVASAPATLGVYTRVGDHLGLQLTAVRQRLMVVGPDGNVA